MDSRVLERLRARAHAVRVRAAVQRWQYRQRNLAAGVWFRLRRVLVDAKSAYVIPVDEARRLIAEGCRPEPCGGEIAPEKLIFFVDEARLSTIVGAKQIRVGLGPEFLAASAIALVPFGDSAARIRGASQEVE